MKQVFWINSEVGQQNSVSHFCLIAGVELLDCGYRVTGSLLLLLAVSEIIPGLAGALVVCNGVNQHTGTIGHLKIFKNLFPLSVFLKFFIFLRNFYIFYIFFIFLHIFNIFYIFFIFLHIFYLFMYFLQFYTLFNHFL